MIALESGTSSQQAKNGELNKTTSSNHMERLPASRNSKQLNGNSSFSHNTDTLEQQKPVKTMVLNRTQVNGVSDKNSGHVADTGNGEANRKSREYSHRKPRGGRIDDSLLLQRPTILAKPTILTNSRSPEVLNTSTLQYTANNDQENGKRSNGGSVLTLNKDENSRPSSESTTRIASAKTALAAGKNGASITTSPSVSIVNSILTSKTTKESLEKPAVTVTPLSAFADSIQHRLCAEQQRAMVSSVKLLDEDLQWHDQLGEHLTEQTDYLVVGVLGKKAVGKSTLMSLLAGTPIGKLGSAGVFRAANKETVEQAQSRTSGINAFVTAERTILLDVQPLLSGSILDKTIGLADKRHFSVDFKYFENYVEVESLELACFVLSVCNVVIVAEDWFSDPNLFRLLQTAEMLMPNMNTVLGQSTGGGGTTTDDLIYDHHPHLVYLLNKSELHSRNDLMNMKSCINSLMKDSKLAYKGSIGDLSGLVNSISLLDPGTGSKKKRPQPPQDDSDSVNFVVFPKLEPSYNNKKDLNEESPSETISSEFKGLPSMDRCVRNFLHELLTVRLAYASFTTGPSVLQQQQQQLQGINSTSLSGGQFISEKRWFAYATKVWETIRKSPLISEYNRLLT